MSAYVPPVQLDLPLHVASIGSWHTLVGSSNWQRLQQALFLSLVPPRTNQGKQLPIESLKGTMTHRNSIGILKINATSTIKTHHVGFLCLVVGKRVWIKTLNLIK